MSKKIIIIAICILACIVGIGLGIHNNQLEQAKYIDANDYTAITTAVDSMPQYAEAHSIQDFTDSLKYLGLLSSSKQPSSITNDFIDYYISKVGIVDTLNNYYVIKKYANDNALSFNEDSKQIIDYLLSCMTPIDETILKNNNGLYYVDHPTKDRTSQTTGGFNDSSNGNAIYYASKTNTYTYEAYGNFEKCSYVKYTYDEGRYEWVNGKFYDEPASFKKSSGTTYYFCGTELGSSFSGYYFYGDDIDTLIKVDSSLEKVSTITNPDKTN